MAGMAGTMGLGLAAFVPIWTLMMAAMMLPSVTPTATLYAKTMQRNRAVRIAGLVAGYLAVWVAAALPAYGLAWLAGWWVRLRWLSRWPPSGSPGSPRACTPHPP
jgi:predicted metal-binding membrane protein